MIDTNKILFRASCNHLIMKNDRSGKAMGETAKSYLKKYFRELKYQRHEEVSTKQMERGKESEENGISLLSLHTKTFYRKCTEKLENDFFTGHPDLVKGNNIQVTEEGVDIKCSWNLFTLPFSSDGLDDSYYYQNLTYCDLTGAKKWSTVYTLVNLSASQLDDEKRRWSYRLGGLDPESNPLYIEKCKELERLFIVDMAKFQEDYPYYDLATDINTWEFDIPRSERVVTFETLRDDEEIERMKARVLECRIWIAQNLMK